MFKYLMIAVVATMVSAGLIGCTAVSSVGSYYKKHCEFIGTEFHCQYIKVDLEKVKADVGGTSDGE